jgi:hypothetical protein
MVLAKLRAILKNKGFKLFTRPYELNIVGLRSESTSPNRFDDEIHVFYKVSALKWNYHVYKATTDPGTFWLKNPIEPQGTAILSEGQFKDAYTLGLHRGQYKALVQQKPVSIMRDYDRNAKLDFLNGKKSTGLFGINIHRASSKGRTKFVDKFSAGCQVFENATAFGQFLLLCEHHSQLYGNKFTYTLIDFRAVKRETFRRIALSAGLVGLIAIGYLSWMGNEKLKTIADQITETFINIFKPKQANEF